MTAYYNDNEPYVCDWLENLIAEGLIAEGHVDRRSITDVDPRDLRGYTQVHFFAGIGGWSYALRLADWPDDREVWTGSCPCQPFSGAGKQKGFADERHLWPIWRKLIDARRPSVVFGEQVASKLGRTWLARVRSDMETLGYDVGAADLCAASQSAPHIRQRLWFVADGDGDGSCSGRRDISEMRRVQKTQCQPEYSPTVFGRSSVVGSMADGGGARLERRDAGTVGHECAPVERNSEISILGDAECNPIDAGRPAKQPREGLTTSRTGTYAELGRSGNLSFWDAYGTIPCRDGKTRRVEPGTFPLAHGIPARVAKLRAFGNAIVPQVAAAFIRAYMQCQ